MKKFVVECYDTLMFLSFLTFTTRGLLLNHWCPRWPMFFPRKIHLGIIRSQGVSTEVRETNITFRSHRHKLWPIWCTYIYNNQIDVNQPLSASNAIYHISMITINWPKLRSYPINYLLVTIGNFWNDLQW